MKTYVKFGALMTLIVGSLVWLAVGGVSDTKTYYKTIAELGQLGDSAHSQRLRVGGYVKPGSILKNGSRITFTLHQQEDPRANDAQLLTVVYTGTDSLPDTFKDNAQALADGRLGPNGTFEANKIQAKCASKYEAKPMQRGLSHEPAGTKVSSLQPAARS